MVPSSTFHVLSVFYISMSGIAVSLLINLSDKPSCQHDVVPQEYKWEEAHLVVVKPKSFVGLVSKVVPQETCDPRLLSVANADTSDLYNLIYIILYIYYIIYYIYIYIILYIYYIIYIYYIYICRCCWRPLVALSFAVLYQLVRMYAKISQVSK